MGYFKNFFAAVLIFLFIGACFLPQQPMDSYVLVDRSTAGLGDEIRKDPSKIGKLFSVPEEMFAHWSAGVTPRGWLGVAMHKPSAEAVDVESGKPLPGIEVKQVFPKSPASRAGLMAGDIIFEVGGKRFKEDSWEARMTSFRKGVLEKGPGTDTTLTVMREGKEQRIKVTLGAKPKVEVRLRPRPEASRDWSGDSVVRYAMEKEDLLEEYLRTAGAIRERASEMVSPVVKHGGYNPFRLTLVNDAIYFPFELPLLADEVTESLHLRYNRMRKDLPGLIDIGKTVLDLALMPEELRLIPVSRPSYSLMGFIEQFVESVTRAKRMRDEAISFLSDEELETLFEMSGTLLSED
ncbi:MAG: PDZ domain-containing protein, partial [Nitrospinaceae bacterium]